MNLVRQCGSFSLVAGRIGVEEAVSPLRELEASSYLGTVTGVWHEYSVRQVVQLSLRRLGEMPADLPSMEITRMYGASVSRAIARSSSSIRRRSCDRT